MGWNTAELAELAEWLQYPVRKLAHMTEFGILSVLMFHAIKNYKFVDSIKKRYLFAWLGAVAYAVTDEFHQLFVPGRSGNLFDVCVDATGVTIALCLTAGAIFLETRYFRGRIRQF